MHSVWNETAKLLNVWSGSQCFFHTSPVHEFMPLGLQSQQSEALSVWRLLVPFRSVKECIWDGAGAARRCCAGSLSTQVRGSARGGAQCSIHARHKKANTVHLDQTVSGKSNWAMTRPAGFLLSRNEKLRCLRP